MSGRFRFERLVHSDWSKNPKKRWAASAARRSGRWYIDDLENVAEPLSLLRKLAETPPTLAGFDFVLGFPTFFQKNRHRPFPEWLSRIDASEFSLFANVAEKADQITEARPFYPRNQLNNPRLSYLSDAHKCSKLDLFRQCELRTANREAGSPLFWTIGAKQVGRAALAGWRDIIKPALEAGVRIWPFHGTLEELQDSPLTICETYPSEAYHHIGLSSFSGKRSQNERRKAAVMIFAHATKRNVEITETVRQMVADGFGPDGDGEDRFDALVGLLSMIEVTDRFRPESPSTNLQIQRFEGWILGQIDPPLENNPS